MLGGGFKYFHSYLGKISNFTKIFQMGWNHQPVWNGFQQDMASVYYCNDLVTFLYFAYLSIHLSIYYLHVICLSISPSLSCLFPSW